MNLKARENLILRNGIVRLFQILAFIMLVYSVLDYGLTSLNVPGFIIAIILAEVVDRQTRQIILLSDREDDINTRSAYRLRTPLPSEPPRMDQMLRWPEDFEAKH